MKNLIKHKRKPILNGYRPEANTYDEMWCGDGEVQPHWQQFIQAIEDLGRTELVRSRHDVLRLLRENGVTYNVHGDPDGLQRPWALDIIPLIISEQDWAAIETGMKQRAELLNLVLTDIYGARQCIKEGLLPLELIYSHSGFLRQCDQLTLSSTHQLVVYAADLARGPDNQMWVLGDRTQAPSGAGYALENRTVIGRVFRSMLRDCQVDRLSNFFRELQTALAELAPQQKNAPRVVVLTPGPHNETYFEHTYLASYLGYSLVQGDDLTVRDGSVWLKSLEGLQQVDVILRRVDDQFCDPLELRQDSRLGVAGLLEAARRGNVAIANPLGNSVLENPGLMPFLPGLARYFLGEDLKLPSAATWWCGQPKELEYVLENLDTLVIKRLARQPHSRTVYGSQLSKKELAVLRETIKAFPAHFVGQEQVSFSTTPSLISGHFEARHAVMRSFLVARDDGYVVMPGGLTRSAPERGEVIVSNQAGGISKDTWVLTTSPKKHTSLWMQTDRIERVFRGSQFLPSRAAENLFWVGRYVERAEGTARLLRTTFNHLNAGEMLDDEVESKALRYLLKSLTHLTMTYPGFVGKGNAARLLAPEEELRSLALEGTRPGSLLSNLQAMGNAAYAVRDLWSTDTWRVIDGIEAPWVMLEQNPQLSVGQIQKELNALITRLMAFAGLSVESMTQEAGWLMLDIGRRLERALLTISFIRSTLSFRHDAAVRHMLLDMVLTTTENIITYRRHYRSQLQTQTVLDLLLLAATNPRSVAYQLDKLQTHISQLPLDRMAYRLNEEERLILEATTRLRLSDTLQLAQTNEANMRNDLDELMSHLTSLLSQLSQVINQNYFSHAQVPHQLLSIQPDSILEVV